MNTARGNAASTICGTKPERLARSHLVREVLAHSAHRTGSLTAGMNKAGGG
jgi:hypothetical protein